jgi:hypothetical protein
MCRLQRGLILSCGLALLLTSVGQAAIFTQNFEGDTLGDAAGWTAGTRNPQHFDVSGTPGVNRPTIGVTNSDSVSPDHSIEVVGVANGNSMHAWRDYGGLSSNGVDPITVSFDFKITSLTNGNFVVFNPFVFNTALFGSAGTPGPDGGVGWPVELRVLQNGFIDYAEDGGVFVELLPAGSYIPDTWAHVTATLNGSQDYDLSITMLTGANAGLTDSITEGEFQVATPANYYDNALDELRGFAFYTRTDDTHGFLNTNAVRIDNFSVTIVPEPVSLHMLALGGIFVMGFRRAFKKRFAA